MTLSSKNSNKDCDFVGLVYIKIPCLFYFRRVKFHYVKETHDINSLLTLVKIVPASQHKRQPNCQDLFTIESTDSDESARAALCK